MTEELLPYVLRIWEAHHTTLVQQVGAVVLQVVILPAPRLTTFFPSGGVASGKPDVHSLGEVHHINKGWSAPSLLFS